MRLWASNNTFFSRIRHYLNAFKLEPVKIGFFNKASSLQYSILALGGKITTVSVGFGLGFLIY